MKVHYPKLYNMAHHLALYFYRFQRSNNYFYLYFCIHQKMPMKYTDSAARITDHPDMITAVDHELTPPNYPPPTITRVKCLKI